MNKKQISAKLKEQNITLAVVESFTGGLFASEVTSIAGVSSFFKGGLVTYATSVKEDVLGVTKNLVKKYGVISSECALAMSEKGRKFFDSKLCLSFTGNAGPEAIEQKEVGEVYIGFSSGDNSQVYSLHLKGRRNKIRKEAVKKGWKIIENYLLEQQLK